jgi:OOP family OmpA-OmpF porin
VVVVPDSQGHVGGVVVDDGKQQLALETAGAAARMGDRGRAVRSQVTNAEVDRVFAAALAAAPLPTSRFSLFFDEGTERLTPESEQRLPAILDDLRRRSFAEVEVLGHTDRTGDDESNLALSQRRADFVRDWLAANGIPLAGIASVGRGEADPVVATEDGVSEPRNRRVEVTIR